MTADTWQGIKCRIFSNNDVIISISSNMANTTKQLVLYLLLLDVVLLLATAEKLASSGYPIKGANPQRNNKINRGVSLDNYFIVVVQYSRLISNFNESMFVTG